jgi:hypothetical protein
MSIRSSGNLWPFSPILVSNERLLNCMCNWNWNCISWLAVEHKIYAPRTKGFYKLNLHVIYTISCVHLSSYFGTFINRDVNTLLWSTRINRTTCYIRLPASFSVHNSAIFIYFIMLRAKDTNYCPSMSSYETIIYVWDLPIKRRKKKIYELVLNHYWSFNMHT